MAVITTSELFKKLYSGGGGSVGAIEPNNIKTTDEIMKNTLPIPTIDTITQKETALSKAEETFSKLGSSIDEDYKLYQDYSKQLDDLELQIQEAPEELLFKLTTDYKRIQALHNTLVDKIKANTTQYEQTKKEYDFIRDSYEKDVNVYNKWASVSKNTIGLPVGEMSKPEDKPLIEGLPMSTPQDKPKLDGEQQWQELMTTDPDIDIKQIPTILKNKVVTDFLTWKEYIKDIPNLKWNKEEGGFRSDTKLSPELSAKKLKYDTLASQYGVNIDEWVPTMANVTFGALMVGQFASVAKDLVNRGIKIKPVNIPKEEVKESFVRIMKSITPEGKISSELSDNDLIIAQYFRKWIMQGGTPEALKNIMAQKGGLEIPQAVNVFGDRLRMGISPNDIVKYFSEMGKLTTEMQKGLDPIKVSQVTQTLLNTSPMLASAFLKAVENPPITETPATEKPKKVIEPQGITPKVEGRQPVTPAITKEPLAKVSPAIEETPKTATPKDAGLAEEANLPAISFKKSELKSQTNNVLVNVDVQKLDTAWKRDIGYYIEQGKESIKGRRAKFEEFLKKNEPIEAPVLNLKSDGQTISFGDGRHRFAVLRDMGYKQIQVSIPKGQVELFNQFIATTQATAGVKAEGKGEVTTEKSSLAEPVTEAEKGKVSGVAERINANAIEMDLTKGFGHLAEYTPGVIKEQAKIFSDLINNHIDTARSMVRGETPIPANTRGSALYTAMKIYSTNTANGELMQELASSPLVSELSAAGSELSLSRGSGSDIDAVKEIQDINKIVEETVTNKNKKSGKSYNDVKNEEINKSKSGVDTEVSKANNKFSWTEFIRSIQCQ